MDLAELGGWERDWWQGKAAEGKKAKGKRQKVKGKKKEGSVERRNTFCVDDDSFQYLFPSSFCLLPFTFCLLNVHLGGGGRFALTMIDAMIRFSSSASWTNAEPDSPGLSPDSMSNRNQ